MDKAIHEISIICRKSAFAIDLKLLFIRYSSGSMHAPNQAIAGQ
jgi:hypothetical protein